MFNPSDHLDELIALSKQAGSAIMPYWRVDTDVIRKDDGSPVTKADQASEDVIVTGLQSIAPSIPIVAEELVDWRVFER